MQEERETKRKRGPGAVSCAECRRLKLKCDRKLPCSSCFKRGCAAICPNGTLAAGPGNRFVLADTQHLHDKIETMSKRISDLEDALGALQAQVSNEKHPLLADELMKIKAPPPTENVVISDTLEVVSENFGTLALGERAYFFGRHAVADFLLIPEEWPPETPAATCTVPADILLIASEFSAPRLRDAREATAAQLASWLPPISEATALVELYYRDATWLFLPIPRDEFNATIFDRVYSPSECVSVAHISPHELSLLFMIFALACMVDLNRPPYNVDGANYYQLARAALALDPIIDHPTLNAIRTLLLMSTFLQMFEHLGSATTSYSMIGLMVQLCQSLGLHRDDTSWNLCDEERQKRRCLFWNVASYDLWLSHAFGRPPSLTSAHVDAKLPDDREQFLGPDGQWNESFRHWNGTFIQKVLFKVAEEAFGATPPSYATVLRLDRLVREHPLSPGLRTVNVGEAQEGVPMPLLLQRAAVFSLTQRVMLFLHRSFFAHALTEHPADPLKSKYAQSVLAAYRAAFYIAAGVRALHEQAPLALRFWVFWSPLFSASLILASIVVKAPGGGLAPPAWVELNRICELLESVARSSRRVARIMPKMRNLRQRAHDVYTAFSAATGDGPRPEHTISEIEDMELRFLYGRSRLVDKSYSNKDSPSSTSAASSASPPETTPASGFPVPSPSTQWPTGPSTLSSSSDNGVAQNANATVVGPAPVAPVSDMWDTVYSAFWPSADQPNPTHGPFSPLLTAQALPPLQQQQQQQQQNNFWLPDSTLAPPPPPNPQFQQNVPGIGAFAMLDSYSMQQRLQSSLPAWNYDLDVIPMLSTQSSGAADTVSTRNLDIPWQQFMSGIGVDEPHEHEQPQASGSNYRTDV